MTGVMCFVPNTVIDLSSDRDGMLERRQHFVWQLQQHTRSLCMHLTNPGSHKPFQYVKPFTVTALRCSRNAMYEEHGSVQAHDSVLLGTQHQWGSSTA